jgi:hypothetical protein
MRRAVLYCALLGACTSDAGSPDGTADPIGKGDVVNPGGTDNEGYFAATAPPSTRGYYDSRLFFEITPIAPNQTIRVPPGDHTLNIFGHQGTEGYLWENAHVSVGQTTKLALAWIHPHWDPAAFQVDVGPAIAWPYVSTNGVELPWDSLGLDSSTPNPPSDTVTFPGTYVFDFRVSALPPTTVTVHADQGLDLDLTDDRRAGIHVIPPSRTYPDSPCAAPVWELDQFASDKLIHSGFNPDKNLDTTYHAYPVDADGGWYQFQISLGMQMGVPLASNHTFDIHVRRIDVNDVAVTREDGSIVYVPGTYVVSYRDPTSGSYQQVLSGVFCSNPTRSGVDVIPGQYKVVTTYDLPEGEYHDTAYLDLR